MSTMDTSTLARIMLGGLGQGAGMATDAAQIGDARQRAAAMQQRYAQEVAYRQQQQQAEQARQLAQMSALANFAEQRGLLQQPQMPPQGSSPVGPFQPGMEPQQAGPSMGLDRQTLMGMDPATARSVVDDMMLGQRQMENARFDADLKNQMEQRKKTARSQAMESMRTQLERDKFPPHLIAMALDAAGLAELGTPAGTINQMFEPQAYQRTADDYRTLLGMPGPAPSGEYGPFQPGAEPAMGQDQADVFARDQTSISDAARLMPDKPKNLPPEAVNEMASHIKAIIPNITDEQARSLVVLRDNDLPFGLPDANLSGETRTKASEADKVVLAKIGESLRQARSTGFGDEIVALEHEYRDQYERTYGQPFPIPMDYTTLARTEARLELKTDKKEGKPEDVQRRSAELEQAWRSQYAKPEPPNELDAMVPQVVEQLRARLGRNPTRDEVMQAMRSLAGG